MAISMGGIVLLIALSLYLSFRLEKLDNIWEELEDYESEVEAEFLEFLATEYLAPVMKEIEPSRGADTFINSMFDNRLQEIEEQADRLREEGVPEEEVEEIIMRAFKEDLIGNPMFQDHFTGYISEMFEEPRSFFPTNKEYDKLPDVFDARFNKTNDSHEAEKSTEKPHIPDWEETWAETFAYLMYKEDILQPREFFFESKKFYRKRQWPNRLFLTIKTSIILIILSVLVLILFTLIDDPLPPYIVEISIIFSVIWIISELMLYYILNLEVEMKTRTSIGKFLRPDPREFI